MADEEKKQTKAKNKESEPKKDAHQDEGHKSTKETVSEKPPLLDEPISVRDYIYLSIISLDAKAWAYMDYVVHPETQKHKKDLDEAKNAIDAIDALYKTLEKALTVEQKKDIETRLTNLRLNFAKQ